MSGEGDNLSECVGDAMGKALHEHHGAMVTRWVATVEVLDREGEQSVWLLHSPDLAQWDMLGLLDFAGVVARVDPH